MRMTMLTTLAAAAAVATIAMPATARELDVPAAKGWQHAASGIVLRATLLGLPRTRLVDSTDGEWDVAPSSTTRPSPPRPPCISSTPRTLSVPVWFDRAEYALFHRPGYGGARPATAAVSFAPPGSPAASGLRRVFVPATGTRSAGLAVMPLGAWLIAVRLSSVSLEPSALDQQLVRLIAEIGWPASASSAAAIVAPGAMPVPACTTHLASAKAKLRKPDLAQALLGSVLARAAGATPDKPDTPPARWCRDGEGTPNYGVYRTEGTKNSYTLALGDSGRSANVFPALSISTLSSGDDFVVTLDEVDGSVATFPSFDRLPMPEQVLDLVGRGHPVSRTTTNGKDVNITLDGKLAR